MNSPFTNNVNLVLTVIQLCYFKNAHLIPTLVYLQTRFFEGGLNLAWGIQFVSLKSEIFLKPALKFEACSTSEFTSSTIVFAEKS